MKTIPLESLAATFYEQIGMLVSYNKSLFSWKVEKSLFIVRKECSGWRLVTHSEADVIFKMFVYYIEECSE